MAMGFFKHLAGNQADVYSGGSQPADGVNPAVVAAMAEKGIDIASEQPTLWTMGMLEVADVVISMGCGDSCPVLPGRRYEEWVLPDPAGPTGRRDTTDPRRNPTAGAQAAGAVRGHCQTSAVTPSALVS